MRNFLFLVLLGFFFSGTSPIDKSLKTELNIKEIQIKDLNETIQFLQCELESSKDSIAQLKDHLSPKAIRSAYANLLECQTLIPGTRFAMKSGVDPRISPQMMLALVEYQGPPILVTSARRHTNKRSHHFEGNAIDISSLSSKAFVSYIQSAEGAKWLEEHGLFYYIEDTTYSSFLKELDGPNVFVNPFATGPHIHVYLKHS